MPISAGSLFPYVFSGLAAVMGLIVAALIVLVCSNRRSAYVDGNFASGSDIPVKLAPLEREPMVMVVIMAGDEDPSYLAKPYDVLKDTGGVAPVRSSSYLCPSCCPNHG